MGPHWEPSPASSLQLRLEAVLLFLSQAGQLKAKCRPVGFLSRVGTRPACCPAPSSSRKEGKGGLGEDTHQRTWPRAEHSLRVTCLAFLLSWTSSVNQKPALPPPAAPRPSPLCQADLRPWARPPASPVSGLSFACCWATGFGSACLKLFLPRSLRCPQGSPNPPQGPHSAFGRKMLPLVLWANFLSSLDAELPWAGDTLGILVLGRGWSQVTCFFSMKYILGFPDSL